MGNAVNSGSGGRKAKIMRINGEFFELGTPAKVRHIIHNYPDHVLLDSDEFRRFSLRAPPLDPEFDLQPNKIYLLVQLPTFPTSQRDDNFETETAVRVKVKLPKAQVERILQHSCDDAEAAGKIIDLCMDERHKSDKGEEGSSQRETEIGESSKLRIPYINHRSKYTKLTSD